MPRMCNWNEVAFYRPRREASYEHIDALFDCVANWRLIEAHWKDLMQVALSVQAGTVLSVNWDGSCARSFSWSISLPPNSGGASMQPGPRSSPTTPSPTGSASVSVKRKQDHLILENRTTSMNLAKL